MQPVQSTPSPAIVQQGHTVISQPGYPGGPVVIGVQPQRRMNVEAIRGLGITQIVIGILTIGFGIGSMAGFSSRYWLTKSGGGIWGGAWILITGIVGVLSSGKPDIKGLNGIHMGFCILATVVTFIDGIFFAVGIGFYANCKHVYYSYYHYYYLHFDDKSCFDHATAGRTVYSILLLLMVIEFFVALVAAVYCCQATCCCGSSTTGIVLSSHPAQEIAIHSTVNHGFVQQQTYPTHNMAFQGYGYPQQQFQQTPITASAEMTKNDIANSTQYQGNMVKMQPPPPYQQ